jgi:hypothetical protein
MRVTQKNGSKGSLKWIQALINKCPEILDQQIKRRTKIDFEKINWLSPLGSDKHAEYRDAAFLKVLGLEQHSKSLQKFWPERGPQWDALGRDGDQGPYFLGGPRGRP